MTRIAIVTDSTANLNKAELAQYNITEVPLLVNFSGEIFLDGIDISPEEFYAKMATADELPKTSQPTTHVFSETYKKLAQDYDHIISIHISSKLSGTLQAANIASQEISNAKVHIYDSELVAMPQGDLAIAAAELASKGATASEIILRLEEMKLYTNFYGVVPNLNNLIKGGRISNLAGSLGSLLQIKPILTMENGLLESVEKVRTFKKALKTAEEMFDERVKSSKYPLKAHILHANNEAEAKEWLDLFQAKYPQMTFSVRQLTPVIGVHSGEGLLGISWSPVIE